MTPKPLSVFLDREALGIGGSLTPKLEEALRQSGCLIVICSPNSARSEWVAKEIEYFKSLGRAHRIFPVLIDGGLKRSDEATDYFPEPLLSRAAAGNIELPLYGDFRVREHAGSVIRAGWTSKDHYKKQLIRERLCHPREVDNYVAEYSRQFDEAKFKLLSGISGLAVPVLVAEELRRQELRGAAHLKKSRLAIAVALAMLLMTITVAVLWMRADKAQEKAREEQRIADQQRRKAQRSALMIGDAHENASGLLVQVLKSLQTKLEPGSRDAVLNGLREIIADHFAMNQPRGSDAESKHLRSVLLNSNGRIEQESGNPEAAEALFRRALKIREELHQEDSSSPLFIHDLAVSHDMLGWIALDRGIRKREANQDPESDWEIAITEFRESLSLTRRLPSEVPYWLHNHVVSYVNLGRALDEAGRQDEAIEVLQNGLADAERLSNNELSYTKWTAAYGSYCLELARLRALYTQPELSRELLNNGKAVYEILESGEGLPASIRIEYRNKIRAIEDHLSTARDDAE